MLEITLVHYFGLENYKNIMDSPHLEQNLKDVFEIFLDVIRQRGTQKKKSWRRPENFGCRGGGR
jgi:hypothetical protein